MPTYEYHCSKCHKQFDLSQSIKDEALKTCPKEACRMKTWGKGKVQRSVGGGAGLIFKGTGFYITDYRSDSYKAAAKKDAPPSAAPASTESKTAKAPPKAESKPAKSDASG